MKDQILLLTELQRMDQQIDHYEADLARLPAEAQEIARRLVSLRREIDEAGREETSHDMELRKKELDLATEQEKIKRSEKRLLGIKNQKEFNALNREIKLGKKVVGELEDVTLDLMGKLEKVRKDLEKKKKLLEESEQSLIFKKAEAAKSAKEANDALSSLTAEKSGVTEQIDREFLKKYETIKNARGYALAEVNGSTCSACHMTLPPQLAIDVLKQEEMLICPLCHRILYVRPENIPEYNKME